jgi:hypothetical protein
LGRSGTKGLLANASLRSQAGFGQQHTGTATLASTTAGSRILSQVYALLLCLSAQALVFLLLLCQLLFSTLIATTTE